MSPEEVKGESMESMDRVELCTLVGGNDKSHINVDMAKRKTEGIIEQKYSSAVTVFIKFSWRWREAKLRIQK